MAHAPTSSPSSPAPIAEATAPQKPRAPLPLRRLLALSRPEWRRLGVGTVFLVLGSGMTLVYPQAMRVIIDEAIGAANAPLIDKAALLMGVVFLVQSLSISLRYFLFTTAGERVVARLRTRLFSHLVTQEIGFFDARRTGELVSRLASDTTVLQNTVSSNISMVLRNAATAIGATALLFYTSPILTVLMLALVPPVALGAVIYGRKVRGYSRRVQDALAKASEVAEETLSSIRTVRSFDAEQLEAKRYEGAVEHSYQLARSRVIASSTFVGAASFAAYGSAAIVLWYGGHLVLDGELTVGSLTAFLVYSLLLAFSLGALADLWADFMRAGGAAERVFELLDREPALPSEGGTKLEQTEGRVELQDVAFSYPTRPDIPVLDGVSLTIEPGEKVAVVGPSGAGKSTLAALIARFYDPERGALLLDGRPLSELDPSWLRRQIGTVSQEPTLFSTTIAENIRYGRPDATDADVETAARAAHAHDFVISFPEGYATEVGERGVQLSGGQKQRVAIARALLKSPRLLVLDEATSALDSESEHLVQEALDALMRGRTTLIIAHRLSTVRDADRVLVLEKGRLVQSGTHDALVSEEGLYRRLVERQFAA